MSDDGFVMEHDTDLDERIAAAFARPVEGGQLVPLPMNSVAISDAVITAQKVAVERDEAKILHKLKIMAQAAGEDWYYRYPVGRGAAQTWIEGPSIKCANSVARYYGNCQVDTRIVDNGDSWIIYARFVDYETGFSYTRPFQQRKGQQSIKTQDSGRQLDIALQIGVSKAIRNVVCNALETFTNFAFEEAKGAIITKVGRQLEAYRERVIERLVQLNIDRARVEAMVGRTAENWLAPDVARIIAQLQAIKDGMATIDETWPPPAQSADGEKTTSTTKLDRFDERHGSEQASPAAAESPAAPATQDGPEPSATRKEATTASSPAKVRQTTGKDESPAAGETHSETRGKPAAARPEGGEASRAPTATPQGASPSREAPESGARGSGDAEKTTPMRASPPRSSLWDDPTYTLTLAVKPDNRVEWGKFKDDMLYLIDEAGSLDEIAKLLGDNADHIVKLRAFSARMAEDIDLNAEGQRRRLAE